LLAAYTLGCFNCGYYLVRVMDGSDIRSFHSGGTGSRNVGRLLGTKGFLATLIGDAGKGAAAVWIAQYSGANDWLVPAALIVVICGHIWPIQLSMKGGKGFATFAGGMLLFEPLVIIYGFLLSICILAFIRKTTISGLIALACSPFIWLIICFYRGLPQFSLTWLLYLVIVAVVLYGHRDNISRDLPFIFKLQR
jgi:acyl phosphate:glycerol-3-phosphate acyltransferase